MRMEFGYGKGTQIVEIPDRNLMAVLTANEMEHARRGADAVDYALEHPIGAPKLREVAKKGQKVAVITSDISRPLPSYDVLPSVIRELNAAGVPDEDITVVFALGSHRHHTEEERRHLGIHTGTSSNGTPFDFSRSVVEADLRVALGNIEFHYFAGYSGGVKALMPGVSTPAAIQCNHSLMVSENACAGKLEGNPVRQDLEEALQYCPIHYIVNAVLDEHKHIVYAVAGDVIEAHRAGCRYLDQMYRKPIPERADIVLVSQGGAPKDANLYQTQKALDNAKHAVKKGGTMIVIGACNEGLGSARFEEWLVNAPTSHSMVERIAKDFQLGGHKAAAIAMVLENAQIDLVSEMDDDFVRSIFLNPQPDAQTAFNEAMERYGADATVIAMPFGGATLPMPPA